MWAPVREAERQKLRRRLQMIFQDPFASLNPRWRVDRIIADPIRAFGLTSDRAETEARVGELLRLVGLDPADGVKYPHEFSGGQRQRICIARALSSNPDFIVCDEPTSALDVSVQAQILNLMRDLQDKLGLAYLFISHNLAVVRHMATRIGVMYLGRIVENAPANELFEAPRHPYTRALIDALPDLTMSGRKRRVIEGEIPNPIDPPPGCAFHPRCPLAFARCAASCRCCCRTATARSPATPSRRAGLRSATGLTRLCRSQGGPSARAAWKPETWPASLSAARAGAPARRRSSGSVRPAKRLAAQSAQKVHSKEQIKASAASGGRSLSQHSQLGRRASIDSPVIRRRIAGCCAMTKRKRPR